MSIRYEDRLEAAKLIVTRYMNASIDHLDGESVEDRLNKEIDFLISEHDRYEYKDINAVEHFRYAPSGDGSLDGVASALKDTSLLRDATRILIADRVIELRK